MRQKSLLELFFTSNDLSLHPLFEEIKTSPIVDDDTINDKNSTEHPSLTTSNQNKLSITVPRSGLPLDEMEEIESTVYGH